MASLTRSGWNPTAEGPFAALAVVFLAVALIGGGSSASALSAGVAQIAAAPVLALGIWRLARGGGAPGAAWPLFLLGAAAAVIVIQLIPLPPSVWRALPGHGPAAEGYAAAGMAPPWLPISLAPWSTWGALLGLIPPAAMLCAALTLGSRARQALAATVIVAAVISVGLGALQLAGGPTSALRLYAVTNPGSAVGFFANRNHQADFLAASLPLAAYLAARWAGAARGPAAFWAAAMAAFALVAIGGAVVTGSRAGLLLVVLAALGAAAVARRTLVRRPGRGWRLASLALPAILLVMGAGLAVMAADPPLSAAIEARSGQELRFSLNPEVARAGLDYAPFGSGAGSFVTVYPAYEPVRLMGPAFINHAHDDFIETWLEGGWAGVILIGAFLAWWVGASWKALGDRRRRGAGLTMAGSVIIGLLLIHSLVDYPLRTPALAVLFALACALIVAPPGEPASAPG